MAGSANWDETRRRLAALQERYDQAWALSPEQQRSLFEARARDLAREPAARAGATPSLLVVEFLLASERFAIDSGFVREVYPLVELTPLPCTPPFVLGVVNVRGTVLSVMDIRKFFDIPEKGLGDLNKLLVVSSGEMELGILADTILGVRSIAIDQIQPPLSAFSGIRAEYLYGMTEGPVAILDVVRMLSDRRIVVDERVANGG